jgi:hypothetical protein
MVDDSCEKVRWRDAAAEPALAGQRGKVTAKVLPKNARCQCQAVIAMQFFSSIQGRTP